MNRVLSSEMDAIDTKLNCYRHKTLPKWADIFVSDGGIRCICSKQSNRNKSSVSEENQATNLAEETGESPSKVKTFEDPEIRAYPVFTFSLVETQPTRAGSSRQSSSCEMAGNIICLHLLCNCESQNHVTCLLVKPVLVITVTASRWDRIWC